MDDVVKYLKENINQINKDKLDNIFRIWWIILLFVILMFFLSGLDLIEYIAFSIESTNQNVFQKLKDTIMIVFTFGLIMIEARFSISYTNKNKNDLKNKTKSSSKKTDLFYLFLIFGFSFVPIYLFYHYGYELWIYIWKLLLYLGLLIFTVCFGIVNKQRFKDIHLKIIEENEIIFSKCLSKKSK